MLREIEREREEHIGTQNDAKVNRSECAALSREALAVIYLSHPRISAPSLAPGNQGSVSAHPLSTFKWRFGLGCNAVQRMILTGFVIVEPGKYCRTHWSPARS